MTGSPLTVVMYHYVRPIIRSRYPGIKGLELELFREQLAYVARRYTAVTMEMVVASVRDEETLPSNAALLTFDDGYRDHHDFVLPLLIENGLQGSFFVPAQPVVSKRVLDVNKLHFVLASAPDERLVVAEMELMIAAARKTYSLPAAAELRSSFRAATRFDSPDVAYVKRLLQRILPEDFRTKVVSALFERFVSVDEAGFAEELYLSLADIGRMVRSGMHIGGHGDRHCWLGSLSAADQAAEIQASLAFLRSVPGWGKTFTFSYPYGDYNSDTLQILADLECAAAFTTRVEIAHVPGAPALELPRLDTNDLPKDSQSPPNAWTRQTAALPN